MGGNELFEHGCFIKFLSYSCPLQQRIHGVMWQANGYLMSFGLCKPRKLSIKMDLRKKECSAAMNGGWIGLQQYLTANPSLFSEYAHYIRFNLIDDPFFIPTLVSSSFRVWFILRCINVKAAKFRHKHFLVASVYMKIVCKQLYFVLVERNLLTVRKESDTTFGTGMK